MFLFNHCNCCGSCENNCRCVVAEPERKCNCCCRGEQRFEHRCDCCRQNNMQNNCGCRNDRQNNNCCCRCHNHCGCRGGMNGNLPPIPAPYNDYDNN